MRRPRAPRQELAKGTPHGDVYPHVLVRFYTNPDGSAARRTTVRVLGLLGLF